MKYLLRFLIRCLRFLLKGVLLPLGRILFRLIRRVLRFSVALVQRVWTCLEQGRYVAFGQRRY